MRNIKCPKCKERYVKMYSSLALILFIHCHNCNLQIDSEKIDAYYCGNKLVVNKKNIKKIKDDLLEKWKNWRE